MTLAKREATVFTYRYVALRARVIGEPDKTAGEIPKAFVRLRAGSAVSADEPMDFLKERIADYKRVREIEFIGEVPRTASGTILRRELAEKAKAAASPR